MSTGEDNQIGVNIRMNHTENFNKSHGWMTKRRNQEIYLGGSLEPQPSTKGSIPNIVYIYIQRDFSYDLLHMYEYRIYRDFSYDLLRMYGYDSTHILGIGAKRLNTTLG